MTRRVALLVGERHRRRLTCRASSAMIIWISGKARPIPSASTSGMPSCAATTNGVVELRPPASIEVVCVGSAPHVVPERLEGTDHLGRRAASSRPSPSARPSSRTARRTRRPTPRRRRPAAPGRSGQRLLREQLADVRVAAAAGAEDRRADGDVLELRLTYEPQCRTLSRSRSPTALTRIRVAFPGRYASGTSSTSTISTVSRLGAGCDGLLDGLRLRLLERRIAGRALEREDAVDLAADLRDRGADRVRDREVLAA